MVLGSPFSRKDFLWRSLAQGLFMLSRVRTMNLSTSIYAHYPGQIETIGHLFFDCIHAQHSWQILAMTLDSQPHSNVLTWARNLLEIINSSLKKIPIAITWRFIISIALYTLWTARNHLIFRATSANPSLPNYPICNGINPRSSKAYLFEQETSLPL